MKIWLYLICFSLSLYYGVHVAKRSQKSSPFASQVYPASEFPLLETKHFVFVIYSYNQSPWIQRSLRSILEQEYNHYRIILIDDNSKDQTFEIAKGYVAENNQEDKVTFLQNQEKLGYTASLYQAIHGLQDQEIAIPLLAQDWLVHPGILKEMNHIFQDPDIWISSTAGISYPAFEPHETGLHSFYAAIFKQLALSTLTQEGDGKTSYLSPLRKIGEGKEKRIPDIFLISNEAAL